MAAISSMVKALSGKGNKITGASGWEGQVDSMIEGNAIGSGGGDTKLGGIISGVFESIFGKKMDSEFKPGIKTPTIVQNRGTIGPLKLITSIDSELGNN